MRLGIKIAGVFSRQEALVAGYGTAQPKFCGLDRPVIKDRNASIGETPNRKSKL
jgi:hypothetical protein